MLLAVALVVVKVVAKPLLLLQKKPPPEAYKPPGPPKLAIKVICLGSYMLGPAPYYQGNLFYRLPRVFGHNS